MKTIVPFFYPSLTTKFRFFLGIRDTNYLLFQLYPPLLAVDLVILLVITQADGSCDLFCETAGDHEDSSCGWSDSLLIHFEWIRKTA